MAWDTDAATTCANFVAAYGASFGWVTLAHTPSDPFFTITANSPGTDFVGTSSFTPSSHGTVTTTTPNDPGTGGTDLVVASAEWATRGGSEDRPLLEIIGGELGDQYSRPKQLIQMEIQEVDTAGPVLNIIGNIQDSLNQVGGNNRIFVFNSGEYNVKMKRWDADICEII